MIYVGIDVAKDKHDCFLMTETGECFSQTFTISNTLSGYKKLHSSISSFAESQKDSYVRIGLESTGHYSTNILRYFANLYQVTLINPVLTSMALKASTLRKTKTDKIDAKAICTFLIRNKDNFQPYTNLVYHISALKSLSRERFRLNKELSQLKVSLTRLVGISFPEVLNLLNLKTQSGLEIINKYPIPSLLSKSREFYVSKRLHGRCKTTASQLKEAAKSSIGFSEDYFAKAIRSTIKLIKAFDKELLSLKEDIKKIVESTFPNILSIPGVSHITAGIILGEIGDINRFRSDDQLLAFAGLDPSVYQSGNFNATNTKITKRGSQYLRWAIHQVSLIIYQRDKKYKDFYDKKALEGKKHLNILGHISKKILRLIRSILKNNTLYIPQK